MRGEFSSFFYEILVRYWYFSDRQDKEAELVCKETNASPRQAGDDIQISIITCWAS
jgi:hypothetical protein